MATDGLLLIHGDEPLLTERIPSRSVVRIGVEEGNDDRPVALKTEGTSGISFTSSQTGTPFQLPALGKHNALNALFAIQVGRHFGLTEEEIAAGLKKVSPGEMRLQLLETASGMQVINDAYNASPMSMRASIDLLTTLAPEKEKWVLLGDMLELGPDEADYHREVGRYAVEKGVSRIFTIGERGAWIAEGAKQSDRSQSVVHFSTTDQAIKTIKELGGSEVVLLVKASRGIRLETVVQELIEEEKNN